MVTVDKDELRCKNRSVLGHCFYLQFSPKSQLRTWLVLMLLECVEQLAA